MKNASYKTSYGNSWALVIGINDYTNAPKLSFAVNDAEAVAQVFKSRYKFPGKNVVLLVDGDATKENINEEYSKFSEKTGLDDRLCVFFAGHGITRPSYRGEVGYLVPFNGDNSDLNSLISWDVLTRGAALIPAKHILFVMDACYGGLALNRSAVSGSARFLHNMLQRRARQVITAGKEDELVADGDGPRAGHSIFTGHFLDALEGGGVASEGIITANSLMAYVYDRVATDSYSNQTPHYGSFDGDGDLVLDFSGTEQKLGATPEVGEGIIVELPPTSAPGATEEIAEQVKEYLSDTRYRIALDDLITKELRRFQYLTRDSEFPINQMKASPENIKMRLQKYEDVTRILLEIVTLLSKWGSEHHLPTIEKLIARMADIETNVGGSTIFINLRWYPLTLCAYAGGIAAISAQNYLSLNKLLTSMVSSRGLNSQRREAIVIPLVEGLLELNRNKVFNLLPEHENHRVPQSEYLFSLLQPVIENALFVGRDYEALFDRFEVFFALVFAEIENSSDFWAPPGRFVYKAWGRNASPHNPISILAKEAEEYDRDWPPLRAGLFQSSYDRAQHRISKLEEFCKDYRW